MIKAASAGTMALELLSTERKAIHYGSSSRGIYFKTENKWLGYISFENYRGPLTTTLKDNNDALGAIPQGAPLVLSPQQIHFPQQGLTITLHDIEIWEPPKVYTSSLDWQERRTRLVDLGMRASALGEKKGFAPLLPIMLDDSNNKVRIDRGLSSIQDRLIKLHQRAYLPNAEELIGFLGYGQGLTPSGDDVVLGLFLALKRWGAELDPKGAYNQIIPQIVAKAYEHTTTLSANLIECAGLGLADERLIGALDWLMGAAVDDLPPEDELFSWGASSGLDVLAGFVLALSSKPRGE